MDSRRQQKISHLLKETFSEILVKDGASYYGARPLVTVTKVTVTPDISLARFYLSVYNTDTPEAVIHVFDEHNHDFRRLLGNKLRHSLRKIPELEFYRDDTLDYVERLENIFKDLNKDKESQEPQADS